MQDIPVGTVLYAEPSRVADALKGYTFEVQFYNDGFVWMQPVKFTGNATETGLEVIVCGDTK